MGVDELDSHRTLADGGGAAFGRAGADVTGREHTRDIGLEQVVGVRCCAGEDEAVVVAADGVVEPLGARQRAEEEEQERVSQELAALERDGGEAPVLAVERGYLTSVSNNDAVPLELVDEVVRHCLAEVGAAVEEGDERTPAREPDSGLAGGVAAADDRDTRAGAELGLGGPGGVEDRQTFEFGQPVDR